MKASQRKDVILARLVFAIFIFAILAAVYTIAAKMITSSREKARVEKAQVSEQSEADSWKIPQLAESEADAAETTDGNVLIYMKTTTSVNFRSEATTEGNNVIAVLPTGTQVTLVSEQEDGWDQVEYNGNTGYIKADNLEKAGTANVNSQGEVITTVVTNTDAKLRSGPSTDTSKLASLPKGTELEASGEENGWWKVTYQGKEGYIRKDLADAQ